jgi:hypothetical protein
LPVEFAAPGDELSQGDLFEEVPSVVVHDLLFMVKSADNAFHLERERPASRRDDRTYPANAEEARAPGIVLSHDCEIDKQTRKTIVHVALVRPLDGVPEEHREGFRRNQRHRAFYLPPNGFLDGENYADLRRITVLRADTLLELTKRASMNEDGRRMLREQVFRFFTRRYLPDDWIDWPEEDV